jgi:hypothetical protein
VLLYTWANAMTEIFRSALAALFVVSPVLVAPASANSAFVDALQAMMSQLRPESRQGAQAIKSAYGPLVGRETFADRGALIDAIEREHVALLAEDALRLNVTPRLRGRSPIGEKDLANQGAYVGARPAALGLLYAIASRVESSPVEVTSLVRHMHYQRALAGTNGNANTEVPTHAMGLAFDIALVNTPLATAYEIRDVLREMRDAGALHFIGESKQLVFHVVPRERWFGYFEALHWAMTNIDMHAPALAASPSIEALLPLEAPAPPAFELNWWQNALAR